MLTEICDYLHNNFDRDMPHFYGKFEIKNGVIESFNDGDMGLQNGQYFRIFGSVFNNGVWKYGEDSLPKDEIFDGAVVLMAVPPDLVSLLGEIEQWMQKYGGADSVNMSPFDSESFDGYSYSKAQGFASTGGGMLNSWLAVYSTRLMRWKRL